MIVKSKPKDFNPIEVVGCCVKFNDEFLLLLRQDHKAFGNKWGEPSGKIEEGEDKYNAVIRELKEETGIEAEKNNLIFEKSYIIRSIDQDLIYHSFVIKLDKKPAIKINTSEHKDFGWFNKESALKLDLVHDHEVIIEYFSRKTI